MKGFSFIEIILVLAILSIIAAVSLPSFFGYKTITALKEGEKSIISKLRQAQGKAISNENFKKWGVRFVNPLGSPTSYYELFNTPTNYADVTKVIVETIFLPDGIDFDTLPADGAAAIDVIFNQLLGTIDIAKTINIKNQSGQIKTITIDVTGKI